MSEKNYEDMSSSEKKKEDWMNSKWRPTMGWMYMVVCITDFVIFPVLWSIAQAIHGGNVQSQWNPITLQGAGLFHMAMGAILGIAVYGRTKEKLEGAAGSNNVPPVSSFPKPVAISAPAVSQPAAATSFTPVTRDRPAEPVYPVI